MAACPCGGGHPLWRNGNQPNSALRYACEPAPTVHFGQRSNDVRWLLHTNRDQQPDGSRQVIDPCERPAPTLTAKSGGQWVLERHTSSKGPGWRDNPEAPMVPTPPVSVSEPSPTLTASGVDRWEFRPPWAYERPATTVVGSFCPDVIAAPGYRTSESRQNAEASVRVTVAEASVLQSFPADYPWQGSRTKQFEQVGNAVPPVLAMHVLATVTGLRIPSSERVA